jgi:hypothetical protein
MKLSAYGRTQLARVAKLTVVPAQGALHPERRYRTELVLLSDGVVGVRHIWLKPDGRVDHASGWSKRGVLKRELKPKLPAYAEQWVANKVAQGYERVK